MRLTRQAFSTTLLLGASLALLTAPGISNAQESPLPQPGSTTKINGSLSEAGSMATDATISEISSTTTSTYSKTLASSNAAIIDLQTQKVVQANSKLASAKKVQLVELKSEFVSKDQALKIAKKDNYPFNIAYSITAGSKVKPQDLSGHYHFYVNRKTHQIGVAINSAAAEFLSIEKANVFSIRSGDTLKTTLARWATEAGYQMEWLSEYDYPLKYNYEFTGKLSDKVGPLNKLLSSISDRSYALKAVITKNNVILIKDNDFSPSVLGR